MPSLTYAVENSFVSDRIQNQITDLSNVVATSNQTDNIMKLILATSQQAYKLVDHIEQKNKDAIETKLTMTGISSTVQLMQKEMQEELQRLRSLEQEADRLRPLIVKVASLQYFESQVKRLKKNRQEIVWCSPVGESFLRLREPNTLLST